MDGGPRYGVPGLQVRFPDGTRALEWAYAGHRIGEDEGGATLELRMRDRHYPLAITLNYRVYHDADVIERSLTLDHTSAAGGGPEGGPIEVLRADSAGWALPERDDLSAQPSYLA